MTASVSLMSAQLPVSTCKQTDWLMGKGIISIPRSPLSMLCVVKSDHIFLDLLFLHFSIVEVIEIKIQV